MARSVDPRTHHRIAGRRVDTRIERDDLGRDRLARLEQIVRDLIGAGLDGIENKINPGEPAEKDLYDLEAKEAAKIRTMPGSLDEALNHLEKDHQFLLKGGVFSEDLIEAWISYKRTKEVDTMRLRPHPYEFYLYYEL